MTATARGHQRIPAVVRIAAAAALLGGGLLLLKVALIVVTGNRLPGPVMAALYLVGVLAPFVAAAGVGVALKPSAGRAVHVGLGVLVAFLHVLYIMMLSDAVGALVEPFTAVEYLVDEVPIAVAGLAWVLVGLWLRSQGHQQRS